MNTFWNSIGPFIFIGVLIWGGIALFSDDSSPTSSYDSSYPSDSSENLWEDTSGGTFHGYECTDDCSGHEAGYEWAEDNDIADEADCDGNSNSFNEGCQAYVEENY